MQGRLLFNPRNSTTRSQSSMRGALQTFTGSGFFGESLVNTRPIPILIVNRFTILFSFTSSPTSDGPNGLPHIHSVPSPVNNSVLLPPVSSAHGSNAIGRAAGAFTFTSFRRPSSPELFAPHPHHDPSRFFAKKLIAPQ